MNLIKISMALFLFGAISTTTGQSTPNHSESMDLAYMDAPYAPIAQELTIVGVAAGNQNFATLVAAVKAADLVDTLNGTGPFTVFAPTNDAFDKLPEGTVANLLEPGNKEKLAAVLTYHVVAGEFDAATVVDAIKKNGGTFTVTTVQGGILELALSGDKVQLTDVNGGTALVSMADVAATNGIIHVIDSVVLPK